MKVGLGVRRPSLWSDLNQNSNAPKFLMEPLNMTCH